MAITYTKALRGVMVNTLGGSSARIIDTDTDPYASNAYSQFQKHETMELVRKAETLIPFHAVEMVDSATQAVEQTRKDPYCEAESGDVTVILLANEGSGESIYAADSPVKPLTLDDLAPYIADCGNCEDISSDEEWEQYNNCVNAKVVVSYNGTRLFPSDCNKWFSDDYIYQYNNVTGTFDFSTGGVS